MSGFLDKYMEVIKIPLPQSLEMLNTQFLTHFLWRMNNKEEKKVLHHIKQLLSPINVFLPKKKMFFFFFFVNFLDKNFSCYVLICLNLYPHLGCYNPVSAIVFSNLTQELENLVEILN